MSIICKCRFQYPGALTIHIRTHTWKNLIPCLYCRKKLTTNKAMKAGQKHTAVWKRCDYCNEKFDTIYNKRQHEHGVHGQGWKAPYGQKCAWLGKQVSHQRS